MDPEKQAPAEQRDDAFESKHVKDIIETYENVMNIIDQEERELNDFVNEDPYGEEDDAKRAAKPQVFKARLNPIKPEENPVEDKEEDEEQKSVRPKDEVIDAS